jgi:hypothetical protein
MYKEIKAQSFGDRFLTGKSSSQALGIPLAIFKFTHGIYFTQKTPIPFKNSSINPVYLYHINAD